MLLAARLLITNSENIMSQLTIAAIIAMSEQQLRSTLENEFGVSTSSVKNIDTLQKKLCENAELDYTEFKEALANQTPTTTADGPGLGGGAGDGTIENLENKTQETQDVDAGKKTKREIIGQIVMFNAGASAEEQEDVVAIANGKLLQIKREIYVGVPIAHLNVLKDSKTKERERLPNGALTGKVKETPNFPFTPAKNIFQGEEHLIGKQFTQDEAIDIGN